MKGLDTNVLVRFLVADDVAQATRANELISAAIEAGEPLFVSDVTMCEAVWVLERSYSLARVLVRGTLETILRAQALEFTDADLLRRALDAFARGKGDFADYVILEHARAAGCDAVVTFDKALLRERGFERP